MPLDTRFSHHRRRSPQAQARRWAWVAYVAMILFVLGVLLTFREILKPFIFALLLVYVLAPVVRFLQRRRIPRWGGVLLCYGAAIGLLYGGGMSVAPKLQTESVKVIEKFQGVLSDVPDTFNQLGQRLARFLEKLQGKSPEMPAIMRGSEDVQAAEWGYGPPVPPVPLTDRGDVPALARLEFGAGDREVAQLQQELDPALGRSAEEIEGDKQRSNVVVSRIVEGVYGIRLNESTLQIEDVGDGTFNLIPRAERQEEDQAHSLQSRILKGLRGSLEGFASRIVGEVVKLVRDISSILIRAIVALVVVLMVAGFVLVDYDNIGAFARSLVPSRHRPAFDELLTRLDAGLSGVVRGQLIICLINGVLSGIGFLIFIPEYALTFAILSGVMSIIPIFGTIISTIPAVLIGLTVSFGTAFAVLIWVIGVHALEANFLNPKIIASQAKIHPVVVVFSLIAGEYAFGITGALLAVPVLSIVHSIMAFAFARVKPHVIG